MNQSCRVCGEVAAGYHFGAFTCEGCKSFFGRTYNNRSSIGECKNNNQCVINKKNRTTCKSCRLKKCFTVGMSKSGSRYGRRSNWFKIHCLLQDQSMLQQQQTNQLQQQQQQQQQLSPQQTNQLPLQPPSSQTQPQQTNLLQLQQQTTQLQQQLQQETNLLQLQQQANQLQQQLQQQQQETNPLQQSPISLTSHQNNISNNNNNSHQTSLAETPIDCSNSSSIEQQQQSFQSALANILYFYMLSQHQNSAYN